MLNEFIEKVVVHEREKGYRYSTTQKVDIYINVVGMVELPEVENNIEPNSGFQEKYVSAKSKKMYAPLANKIISMIEQAKHHRLDKYEARFRVLPLLFFSVLYWKMKT